MAIQVVNKYARPYDFYIGRGSKWGNPFVIGKDGSRAEVIEKFENYLLQDKELMQALPELLGKTLGCFCKPQACHGDVLKQWAEMAECAVGAITPKNGEIL